MYIIILGFIWYQVISHFGASILLHKYYCHRQIKSVPVWFEVLGLFCLMCFCIRSPIGWIASHRMHHGDTDGKLDPHSPRHKGFWSILFTTWDIPQIPIKYARDLYYNPILVFFHKHWIKIVITIWIISLVISIEFFLAFVLIPFILSKIGFGLLNTVGHGFYGFNKISAGPKDTQWLNLFIAGEGWHKIHHDNQKQLRLHKYDTSGFIAEKLFA